MPLDYAELAKQAGAVSSQPAGGGVDYSALAKQAGAVSSTPAAPKESHPLADLGNAFWEGIGGKALMDVMGGASRTPEASKKAIDTAKAMVQGVVNEPARVWGELSETGKSLVNGDPRAAAYHAAGAVPIVGAPAQQVSQDFSNGDYAKGFGHALGLLLPFAGSAIPKGAKIPITPGIANPNPAEAGALSYLESKGVPVPAGPKTGNAFVKNIQKAADSTPVGAVVAQNAARETTAALQRTAGDLVSDATPKVPAENHYANFRAAEADPASLRPVPTSQIDRATGRPVSEDMPMPVPVGILKDKLIPIYEEMQWMPAADRNASAGYQAVKKIVEGPDYIPASQAELGLGGLKTMAREGSGRAAGLAKFITPKLQQLIDNAVSNIGGPQAVDALQQGRKAAAAEVGQDWLVKTFKKAEAEGGFNREQGIWADWLRLPDEAKKTMFQPAQVDELNKFFLGVKKLAENPNPSGTAILGISTGAGALILHDPISGVAMALGAGAVSKIMHSPFGVRILSNGLKLPVGSPSAAAAAGQILKLAGKDAQPVQQQ
jgi:hypothetical protein